MTALILRADARDLPLPDESVDLVATSPPYWSLRSYTDGGEHYAGQIGAEPTPAAYVAALLDCTREWVRVLKPTGSLFVNLGDKYSTGNSGDRNSDFNARTGNASGRRARERSQVSSAPVPGLPPKTLIGLPWRYALGCVDDLGLILRSEIVWSKPNGMPESVTDRVRRSHEQLFHFTRQPRYYAAVDEIREAHVATLTGRDTSGWRMGPGRQNHGAAVTRTRDDGTRLADFATSPLGKLPGSVWEIASQPLVAPAHLGVDHFAAFPFELPRRCILGWSPPGICTACGEGRRPSSDRVLTVDRGGRRESVRDMGHPTSARNSTLGLERVVGITGYACACPDATAPTMPAVVLDPFGGTGTTALLADVLGRTGISADMSADYCRLAEWRTTDPGERAKAMQVPKPPAQLDGQDALFPLEATAS